jgi:hypothetical protein
MRPIGHGFERRQRGGETSNELHRAGQFAAVQSAARIGPVQVDPFAASKFFEEYAQACERTRQAAGAWAGARAAEDRALQRGDRAFISASIKPQERVFEQGKQRHRRRSVERRGRGKPCKYSGRCIGKGIAGGILSGDAPAAESDGDAAGERPIRSDQSCGFAVLYGFAQRDRDRQRLLFGMRRLDHRHGAECGIGMRFESGVGCALPPFFRCRGRPHGFGHQPLAAARRRQPHNGLARYADARQ